MIVVLVVIAGVSAAVATRGSAPASAGSSAAQVALVSAPDAESSAWYCTGPTTSSGSAPGSLVLTNSTGKPVSASITAVSDAGAVVHAAVGVPADSVVSPSLASPSSGSWQADTVTVAGGGVAVSQSVHDSAAWGTAPCQSSTAASWYFAGGTTSGPDLLFVSLLNPTSTPVVVDLSFITPGGTVHPVNYQGVVLPPGQVVVENVSAEVQNTATVSTVVTARTGRVVAAELQVFAGSSTGLSVVPGVAQPSSHWAIPQSVETSGGTSEIDVFNPGTTPESVRVHLRLTSGPLAPLSEEVGPGTTWAIATSKETRIPAGVPYSAIVDASGGAGVVVSRTVLAPGSATSPQAGLAPGIAGPSQTSPTGEWLVPPPGTSANPAFGGAAPRSLAVSNTSGAAENVRVYAVSSPRQRLVASGTLQPGFFEIVTAAALSAAGFDPIVVRADRSVGVSEDLAPSGSLGVVTMPGLPLAAAIAP
ncbi:MAG TPA: DUF5719 family protein [Acidimicrobiales bacterium]|nr:DUF5719 family protein [Acidimicrobiales bacterium]